MATLRVTLELHGHAQGRDYAVVGMPIGVTVETDLPEHTPIQVVPLGQNCFLDEKTCAVVGDPRVGHAFSVTMCESSHTLGLDVRIVFLAGAHRVTTQVFAVLDRMPRLVDYLNPRTTPVGCAAHDLSVVVEHLKILQLMVHKLTEVVANKPPPS